MKNPVIIAVDFDGTVIPEGLFPDGSHHNGLYHAVTALQRWNEKGYDVVLNTCREGLALHNAVRWFKLHGVKLAAVNSSPGSWLWQHEMNVLTLSRKVFANIYIDDRGLGVPLDKEGLVDWFQVEEMVDKLVGKMDQSDKADTVLKS
jgi:hydroxymethylpyrimidine pyrophosphatase-like HAD family hydrolase